VYEAKRALERAEASFQEDGESAQTQALAYIAGRKATIAKARANTVAAARQRQSALAELEQARSEQTQAMRERLGETSKELAKSQAQLESERRARVAAEQRTADALRSLDAKEDARGLVVTLTGGVLFAVGSSTLLPTAQKRLDDVVAAIKSDPRPMMIVGHTDSMGSEDTNRQLSYKRAEAVRNYIVTHGVREERIQVRGVGASQPISENTTPDGRANNRRVEIIFESSTEPSKR